MPPGDPDWLTKGACRDHPTLDMDAWFRVEGGIPVYDGTAALAACRFECSVAKECRAHLEPLRSVDAVYGAGWSDFYGTFYESLNELPTLDTRKAAAYLGVTMNTIHKWVKEGILPPVRKREGKYYFTHDEVARVHSEGHAPHGTLSQYRAHLMRGDMPCDDCHRAFSYNPAGLEKLR